MRGCFVLFLAEGENSSFLLRAVPSIGVLWGRGLSVVGRWFWGGLLGAVSLLELCLRQRGMRFKGKPWISLRNRLGLGGGLRII